MKLRPLALGIVAGVLSAALPASPAHALGTGAWQSPANGGVVYGTVQLVFQPSSTAISVELYADGADLGPATFSGSYAYGSWNSTGVLDGTHTLAAKECDVTCDTESISVRTSNGRHPADPSPVTISPASGTSLGEGSTITVTGTGTVAAYASRQYSNGSQQIASHALPWTTTVHDLASSYYSNVSDTLTLTVRHCNGSDCNAYDPQVATFPIISLPLTPGWRTDKPGVGKHSAARLSWSLPQAWSGQLQVFRNGGSGPVVPVRTIGFDKTRAGRHTFTWDGKDSRGKKVPQGTYTAQVLARSGVIVSAAVPYSGAVQVSYTAPKISLVAPSSFNPIARDGFDDVLAITVNTNGYGTVKVSVLRGSTVVGVLKSTLTGSGPISWDGTFGHRTVAAGTYGLRATIVDSNGNTRTSRVIRTKVDTKRLIKRHFSTSVSAASVLQPGSGGPSCFAPAAHGGSVTISADSECAAAGFAGSAAGFVFTIPAGVEYGNLGVFSRGSGSGAPAAQASVGPYGFSATSLATDGSTSTTASSARTGVFASGIAPDSRQKGLSATMSIGLTQAGSYTVSTIGVDGDVYVLG